LRSTQVNSAPIENGPWGRGLAVGDGAEDRERVAAGSGEFEDELGAARQRLRVKESQAPLRHVAQLDADPGAGLAFGVGHDRHAVGQLHAVGAALVVAGEARVGAGVGFEPLDDLTEFLG
jgi:hypothetical protein